MRNALAVVVLTTVLVALLVLARGRDRGASPADAGPPAPAAGRDAATRTASDLNFNRGWVGAVCQHDQDCAYEGGFCLLPEEGFPKGYCSRVCRRLCPDQRGDTYSPTFCVEDPLRGEFGICMAQCNLHLTPSGCRPGYVCGTTSRLGESVARMVCRPDRGTPFPATPCTRKLDQLGLRYARPELADHPSRGARPSDAVPREDTCQVDTPVLLASPIHGVDYRPAGRRHAEHLLVACAMAPAIERLSEILAAASVVEVQHMGTYVCRGVAKTRSLSGHGHALAIDIAGFEVEQGAPVTIARDWRSPDPQRRRWLRALARKIRKAGVCDVLLTPDTNRAHADHLHCEVDSPSRSAR